MSFILPASAIMYASGSTDNNDDSSTGGGTTTDNSGSSTGGGTTTDNSGSSTGGGTTTDNSGSSTGGGTTTTTTTDNSGSSTGGGTTTTTDNSATLPTTSTLSNNTGNTTDLVNSILAVHNSERSAVGVLPLVWSDNLAAGAKTWAEHLATTGEFAHDPNRPNGVGENLAGFNPSKGVSAPGEGQSLWVDEKKNWHGGVLTPENWSPTGHYTQMVWKDTKQVGCATASGNGHPFSILVCRYSPAGNFMGQAPF
jgi:uncharacterized protein YkwD